MKSGVTGTAGKSLQIADKRQRTAALKNLAESSMGTDFAKRLGVRLSSAAFVPLALLTGTFSRTR
jgi:hypothetical protein